jgi:hypothetical protein
MAQGARLCLRDLANMAHGYRAAAAVSDILWSRVTRFRLQLKAPNKNLEEFMKRWRIFAVLASLFVCTVISTYAQSQDPAPQPEDAPNFTVARGTRFLVSLQTKITTKEDKAGKRLLVRTLEPITTVDGTALPIGTEVRGHIDKVQSAGKAGRARLWLTFDDIHMNGGWTPVVAALIDAPGVHSIRVLYDREGEIEASAPPKHEEEAIATAEAAFVGAEPGIAAKNKKDAATGAAMAAATAFMATSGLGQELTLEPNMKLELALVRPLYAGKT